MEEKEEKVEEKTKEEKKKETVKKDVESLYKEETEKKNTKKKTPKKKKKRKKEPFEDDDEEEVEIEKKPKRFLCAVNVFAILLAIILFGEVAYYYIYCEYFVKSNTESSEKQEETTEEESVVENEYNNYTEAEFSPTDADNKDVAMSLKVTDGKLTGKLADEDMTINNISGNVVSFTYGMAENGYMSLLVITDENKIYTTEYAMFATASAELSKIMDFTLFDTTETITNITNYECEASYNTLTPTLAVVLENGEIRTLTYEDTINGAVYTLDDENVKNITKFIHLLKIYNDGTIGISEWYGLNTLYITYNDNKLAISKLFYKEDITKGVTNTYYFISDDLLYQMDIFYSSETAYSFNGVTLVNANKVKSTKDNVITFENDTTMDLSSYTLYDKDAKEED